MCLAEEKKSAAPGNSFGGLRARRPRRHEHHQGVPRQPPQPEHLEATPGRGQAVLCTRTAAWAQ
eukprot:9494932-Pyramimonas_sp.AAC.1